jgi:hypothetical protein
MKGQRERPSLKKRAAAEGSQARPRDGFGWREEEIKLLRRPDLKGKLVG